MTSTAAPSSPPAVRILVCVGPRCDAEGKGRAFYSAAKQAMRENFRDETAAGRLSCQTRDCLRLCTSDPVIRIEPSGDVILDPAIDDLLAAAAAALASQGGG